MNETEKQQPKGPDDRHTSRRRVLMFAVLSVFALLGATYLIYWLMVARYVESTDDAYVGGNLVQITSQVEGIAVEINADDTQFVRAGQTLVGLDRAKPYAALLRDEARLGETVRGVRNIIARASELRAAVTARQIDLIKARADLARRKNLASSGAISVENVQHAHDAVRAAEAALGETREQLGGAEALIDGTTVASNPRVLAAEAQLRASFLDYRRTIVPAPTSGFVAHRTVQVGQRVSPGTPLMVVVPLDEVWVDANFKEGQLGSIRAGQPVLLSADANDFEYHGTVVGFAPGTGAAFALLPAQNATGNWIKVVQRLPVRIALDPKELSAHPLEIGLSMEVRVDVHHRDGAVLKRMKDSSLASRVSPTSYRTSVFDKQSADVDDLIARIVAQNDPASSTTASAHVSRRLGSLGEDAAHHAPDLPASR
jgi:membrane fusion protein, multidrug efflux system